MSWTSGLRVRGFPRNGLTAPVLKAALTLAFIAAGAFYIRTRWAEFQALDWPTPLAVAAVAAGFVISVALRSSYSWLAARRLGAGLTARESFMLSAVVTAGNFFLPAGVGTGLRALYMKRVHHFPVSYYAGTIVTFVLMHLLVVCFVVFVLALLIYFEQGSMPLGALLLLVILALGVLLLLASRQRTAGRVQEETHWWSRFMGGLRVILKDGRLTLIAIGIVSANFLVAAVTWTVALRDYAPEISVTDTFLIAASQIISGFITLTPGAVGFQEMVALYVGRSSAATIVELFAVLVWVRVVRMLAAVVLAVPSSLVLRRRLREAADTRSAACVSDGKEVG